MHCGLGYMNAHFAQHFVALPVLLLRSGLACGTCVELTCVDAVCEDALGERTLAWEFACCLEPAVAHALTLPLPLPPCTAVSSSLFMVADSCTACTGDNIVVSAPGLTNLTGGVNIDRNPMLQVAWQYASCAPLITGARPACLSSELLSSNPSLLP